MSDQAPVCPYCGDDAKLVDGLAIYPHRRDLADLRFWQCAPCDAYVGCHKAGNGYGDGTRPLGRLTDAALRTAKKAAHAAFDPLWQEGHMKRGAAYAWLSKQLGIPAERTHIGEMDVATCRRVTEICKRPIKSAAPEVNHEPE